MARETRAAQAVAAAEAAPDNPDEPDSGTDDSGTGDGKRGQSIWARLRALWRHVLNAIGGWPKPVRWLLTLVGAALTALAGTLGLSNAAASVKILLTQGPSAFWKYIQQQPFGPFALRYPVVFVLVLLVGFVLVRLAAFIRQQNQQRAQYNLTVRAASEAIRETERIKPSELPAKLNDYLGKLCKRYDTLELPAMEELRLSEVAIDLPLTQTITWGAGAKRGSGGTSSVEAAQTAGTTGSELFALLFAPLRTRPIRAGSIGQIPARRRRFVIAGGPDSGKSTLLKVQALTAARRRLDATHAGQRADSPLPIYLSAPDILAAGTIENCTREMLRRLGADARLTAYLMQAIRQGNALLCIDNLDSVEAARRPMVARAVTALELGDETTVLVAMRDNEPPGSVLLHEGFRVWELQDLNAAPTADTTQSGATVLQQKLAERLFAAFDQVLRRRDAQAGVDGTGNGTVGSTPDGATTAQTARTAQAVQDFLKALNADPQSVSWRGNPLLFSVAAAIQEKEGHLPPNRVEMYRRLMEETQRRAGVSDEIGQRLSRRVLADLALWLSRQDRRVLTLDDLLTFLVEVEREAPLGAGQLGDRLVHESVLERVGGGRLSFRYDAFVEYLAAVALAQGTVGGDGIRHDALGVLLETYPLARWHDVLVLVPSVLVQEYGRAGGESARQWLGTLLKQAETHGGDPAGMGIELALDALETLGELPPSWRGRGLADDISSAWVAELRRAALFGQATRQRQLLALAPRLASIGGQARQTDAAPDVAQAAVLQVQAVFDDPDPRVRETMAQAMLALREHARIHELVHRLADNRSEVRVIAARILWSLPAETKERAEALRVALHDDYWPVRFLALTGLAGEVSPAEIQAAQRHATAVIPLVAEACLALKERAGPSGWMGTLLRAQWSRAGLDFADERTTLSTCAAAIALESFGVLAERQVSDVSAAFRRSASAAVDEPQALPAPQSPPQSPPLGAAFGRVGNAAAHELMRLGASQSLPPGAGAAPEPAGAAGAARAAGTAEPGAASEGQGEGEADTAAESREQARQAAIQALQSLGILNDDTLNALRQAAGDRNTFVGAGAGLVLGLLAFLEAIPPSQAGDPAALWGEKSDELMRVAALIWLTLAQEVPTAPPALRASLHEPAPPALRLTAVLLLGFIASVQDDAAEGAQLRALLVEKTRDPSVAVAAAATLMLSAVVPPVSRDALARGLDTSNHVATRVLTLGALGMLGTLHKLDGPVRASEIEMALRDEPHWGLSLWAGVVTEWLRQLEQLAGNTSLELFAKPLRANKPVAQMIAVAALCALGFVGDQDERQLTGLLAGAVGDTSPLVVATALTALGVLESADKLSQPLAEGRLLPALRDTQPLVRLIAVVALTLLADAGRIATPALAEGLGQIAGQAGSQITEQTAGRDASTAVRMTAVLALAALGSESSGKQRTRLLEQLSGALGDRSWWVRASAAIGWVSADRNAPPRKIGEALGAQERVWVRFATAVLLAAEYEPRELPRLLHGLSAEGSRPAAVLARSLRHLRRPGRHDPLLGALHDRSIQRRQRAALMLAALDGLRIVLGESDEAVRQVAVLALGALSLAQLLERAPRGERHARGLEGWLRSLLRPSAQEDTGRDLSKNVRAAADSLRQNKQAQRLLQQVQRLLQRLRQGDQVAAPESQIARLLQPETHWLLACGATLELGLFGALDVLEPANAQRIADTLHDTRSQGQQWVHAIALLVLYSPLLNGYEPAVSEEDAGAVVLDLLTRIDAAWQSLWGRLSARLSLRGLAETAQARTAWLRAAGVWLQGQLAARIPALRDQVTVPDLLELARHDASTAVRWAAISALRQLGDAVGVEALRALLQAHDASALVRAATVDALDARGQQVGAEVFEAALDDPAWTVRVEAVIALRKRQGVVGLQRALGDANPAVRVAAAAFLTTEAQRPKGDPLVAAFGDVEAYLAMLGVPTAAEGAPGPAPAAAEALRELGQHVPPSWAVAVMDRGGDASLQGIMAVQWLGISESLLDGLDAGLQSPSWRVRVVTAATLGMLNDPRATAALRRCAQRDDDATVRTVAAGMLARRDGAESAADRPQSPLGMLLDVLFVLGQDLQTAITSGVRELASGGGSAVSRALAPIAVSLLNPTITADMLERLETLLGTASWSVEVQAAVALSGLQPAASERAVRRMLDLRRTLGDRSDLSAEAAVWLVALDDALRLVQRPSASATPSGQTEANSA